MSDQNLIPLSAGETAALMRASNGEPLQLAFGSGGAALMADKSPWAIPLLRQWRGINVSDGGGI